MGSILKEYMKYQLDLEKKYGTNSVILMQVGSFYEIYSVDKKFGKTIEVSKTLNILQTKKNKSLPHSMSNPYMAGFPVHSIGKHLLKLINAGFTVAIYDQFDSPNKKNKKIRKVVHIYSPSTYIEDEVETKICMGINISEYKCPIQKKLVKECAIVTINLSTGNNQLFTCGDTLDYPNRVDAEIERIIAITRPNEIVHNCKGEFKDYLNHYRFIEKKYCNINYQKKFMEKLFSGKYDITDLELDKYPDLLTCYLFTLQFIYEHDPRIINKIQKPVFLTCSKDIILNNDALTQLHILPHASYKGRYRSLLDIIDFTCTRMGFRLLKSRLYYPCKDASTLSLRYQAVDNMCKDKTYIKVQQQLQGIGDIEKKYRKLVLLKLKPSELGKLSFSFEKINILLQGTELYKKFTVFLNDYKTTFHIDLLDKDCNFFTVPIDVKIQSKLKTIKSLLTQLADKMTQQIDKDMHNLIKLEETEKDGFFFTTTKKRWSVFVKNNTLTQFKKFKLCELKCRELSSAMRITHPLFDKYWGMYKKLQNNFRVLLTRKYNKTLERYHTQYNELFLHVIKYISTIDVEASLAKASVKYGYTRPQIIKSKSSFVNATKMRHPLIERVQDDTEYITTDITVKNGILLYGVNAGGKSSLLRAIGANVILAQMGSFVACKRFEFQPFHHVLCKISSEDNLFKGQSTFVCEMIELRNILNIANSNSLILCDELTAGTETHSATGLVASAIKYLLHKNANFVFTTHLHGLPSLITHDNLKIYHFKVSIQNSVIKYNYTLSEGIGESIYGIEIAKALGLDRDFIIDALQFRANFSRYDSTEFIQDKKSRYNRKVIMDQCEKCGVKDNLHTHHLHEQHLANENGLVNHFPKNIKHNLQVLCQECHLHEHKL